MPNLYKRKAKLFDIIQYNGTPLMAGVISQTVDCQITYIYKNGETTVGTIGLFSQNEEERNSLNPFFKILKKGDCIVIERDSTNPFRVISAWEFENDYVELPQRTYKTYVRKTLTMVEAFYYDGTLSSLETIMKHFDIRIHSKLVNGKCIIEARLVCDFSNTLLDTNTYITILPDPDKFKLTRKDEFEDEYEPEQDMN